MKNLARSIVIFLLILIFSTSAFAAVRKPAVEGSFYPADSAELATMVSGHLDNVTDPEKIDGQLLALIVPHAGLAYSGQVAAYGYKLLENSNINTVILCGPSHRLGFDGISVYGPGITWETPLGPVACDDALCQQFVDFNERISVIEEAHAAEHCLEVQLPYLQTTLIDFHIAPMLVGYRDPEAIDLMANALKSVPFNKNTVMIASTDWQHYRTAAEGWKLDSAGIDCIKRLKPDDLEFYLKNGRTEACGGAAAVAVMRAAIDKGANKVKILKYGDSGDISGDKESVVGYVAAAIYKVDSPNRSNSSKPGEKKKGDAAQDDKFELTDAEKQRLLEIARVSIDSYLSKQMPPEFEVSDNLKTNGAAFVTLKREGHLRGCIGYTSAFRPLYKAVSECAVKAAVEDPRFPKVTADELSELKIEISVLSPMKRAEGLKDIEVGRDGLMIRLYNQTGLLLPQVAVESGWDVQRFLASVCRKAGLHVGAYTHKNAEVYTFQAEVFSEEE